MAGHRRLIEKAGGNAGIKAVMFGRRKNDRSEPRSPVRHVFGILKARVQRHKSAVTYRHLKADILAEVQVVGTDVVFADVAVDGSDAENLDVGTVCGGENRDRIIRAGIAVNDKLSHPCPPFLPAQAIFSISQSLNNSTFTFTATSVLGSMFLRLRRSAAVWPRV